MGPVSAPRATRWMVKLYLLGLLLSLFSALFGLMGFLGDLMPFQGLEPCLPGHWMESEGGSLVDAHSGGLVGDVKLRTPPH